MNITQIPKNILADLRSAEYTDEQIQQMSATEAFEKYCEWNGIIGWAQILWCDVLRLKAIEEA